MCDSHMCPGFAVSQYDPYNGTDFSLNLFQSLDEYSAYVEPVSNSSYECLPTSSHDSRHAKRSCPSALSDIWSHDSISTVDSSVPPRSSSRAILQNVPGQFSDYSHLLSAPFPLGSADPGCSSLSCPHERYSHLQNIPVVLQLANLIL
jgi:hypothetical protein